MDKPVVVIGAGPAGIRACETLAGFGVRPTLLDESQTWGGQIFRQQPGNFKRGFKDLYGFDAERAENLKQTFHKIREQIDYRPQSLVWNAEQNRIDILHKGKTEKLQWSKLIVASGATDRVFPFPGWTLPGVYGLGASQIALKYQACAIGSKVILAGTGPLLYLVAFQYASAGANVVAVLNTAPVSARMKALPKLFCLPGQLARGMYYVSWLKMRGVKMMDGIQIMRAKGETRIEGLVIKDASGKIHELECDALGFGYGLRSETQIADLVSCQFNFNPVQRAFLPAKDLSGKTTVDGVYLAGDGSGIMGVEAAELAGQRAALAVLTELGLCSSKDSGVVRQIQEIESRLQTISKFRAGLEEAFPCPENWIDQLQDDTVVCRCEEITYGDIKQTVLDCNVKEINRLKALSRSGMGRCQGRMCGHATAEILAHLTGQSLQEVGRLRCQPPVKPVPISVVADASLSQESA